jgi:hypothetical protein
LNIVVKGAIVVNTIGTMLWKSTTASFTIVNPLCDAPKTCEYIPYMVKIRFVNIVLGKVNGFLKSMKICGSIQCFSPSPNLFQ